MKYFIYNCFFIIIVLFFAYINTPEKEKEKEAFTPGINAFFRPHIRDARNFSEELYDKNTANISNLFRKSGLM